MVCKNFNKKIQKCCFPNKKDELPLNEQVAEINNDKEKENKGDLDISIFSYNLL